MLFIIHVGIDVKFQIFLITSICGICLTVAQVMLYKYASSHRRRHGAKFGGTEKFLNDFF